MHDVCPVQAPSYPQTSTAPCSTWSSPCPTKTRLCNNLGDEQRKDEGQHNHSACACARREHAMLLHLASEPTRMRT